MTTSEAQQAAARVGGRFRLKRSAVEAIQWTGDNLAECKAFAPVRLARAANFQESGWRLELLAGPGGAQGWVLVPVGHWIIGHPEGRGTNYQFSSPGYFAAMFEPAE